MIKIAKNIDWLAQQAKLIPENIALMSSKEVLNFAQLDKEVSTTAEWLKERKIEEGNHCAIVSGNNSFFVKLLLALWKIGAVPIPLNSRLTGKELSEQIIFTDSKFVLINENEPSNISDDKSFQKIIFPFQVEQLGKNLTNLKKFKTANTAVMLFTSGTASKPKAVILSFDNLFSSANSTDKFIDQYNHDSWLASLPFYHIGGFMIIVRSILSGCSLIIPDSLSSNDLFQAIKSHSPSFFSLVSTQLKRLLESNVELSNKTKGIFIGGGAIEETLLNDSISRKWSIIKVYGSTETTSMITALDLSKNKQKLLSAGVPLEDTSLSILDKNKKKLPSNLKGEIVVEGPSIAKGYYKSDSNKLRKGKFFTSDFGYADKEGYLFVEGRVDDVIISGGENINANEVRYHLLKNPLIIDAYVCGIKDEEWGESVSAVLVCKSGSVVNSEGIKDFLRKEISIYKIPKKYFFVDEIPKTELGKVNKPKLLKLLNLS